MDRKKFTILGETGSGKTCYLLGMYDVMRQGIGKYTIIATDHETESDLAISYENLDDSTLGTSRFPAGTTDSKKVDFDLQYAYKTVLPFEWIDYPGSYLNPATRGNYTDEHKNVEKFLNESSTIFICIDGKNLIEGNIESKIRRVKRKCCKNINPYLGKLKEKLRSQNKRLPPIGIILTKYDLCMNENSEEDIRKIIAGAFEPLFDGKDNFIAVIPVSLGEDISDDDYKGEIEPRNMELPIIFGVNFALIEVLEESRHLIQMKTRLKSDKEYDKRDEEGSFFLWRNNDKINRLKNDISALGKEVEELEKTVEAVEGNFGVINEALRDIDMFFVNGAWQQASDIQNALKELQKSQPSNSQGFKLDNIVRTILESMSMFR